MRTKSLMLIAAVALWAGPARADRSPDAKAALKDIEKTLGFVPNFLRELPDPALPGAWEEMKGLEMSKDTVLEPRVKELIGLAVAAQVPCRYCSFAHGEFAKAAGATPAELGVAVAESGLTRHWSTFLNGMQLDPARFHTELNQTIAQMKKMDPAAPPPAPIELTDSASAYREIERNFGMVPEFLQKFPTPGVVGAWKAMRDVEMAPGPVAPKFISLIGLAVSSQIPCHYCIEADTEFARAFGATDAEIREAVALAAHTRNMSTLLNGMQVDENRFKADVLRLTHPPKGKKVASN